MSRTFHNPCEICTRTNWETLVDNAGPSVCSGREIVQNERPLVKGMCKNCGFVYTLASPLDDNLDDYYEKTYSSKLKTEAYDYINYANGKRFGQAVNEFVLSHDFPAAGRMLDIGCGKGFFEQAFVERYPAWNVEGVDPSDRSIEIARRLAPSAEFHVAKFNGADFSTETYDLVTLHTVINRVSPRQFIGQSTSLLKPDGVMSIAIAVLPQAPFELYFADHHCMYYAEHLLALTEEFGLDMIASDELGSIWRYLFRRSTSSPDFRRKALSDASERIKNEIRSMASGWQALFDELRRFRDAGKRLAFYGAGTTMMILLAQTEFPAAQIAGIFDDNAHKQGETMWGLPVRPVSDELRSADAVVLCAGPSGIDAMKSALGLPDEKLLYHGQARAAVFA